MSVRSSQCLEPRGAYGLWGCANKQRILQRRSVNVSRGLAAILHIVNDRCASSNTRSLAGAIQPTGLPGFRSWARDWNLQSQPRGQHSAAWFPQCYDIVSTSRNLVVPPSALKPRFRGVDSSHRELQSALLLYTAPNQPSREMQAGLNIYLALSPELVWVAPPESSRNVHRNIARIPAGTGRGPRLGSVCCLSSAASLVRRHLEARSRASPPRV